MLVRIGLENGPDGGRVYAWMLDYPGCVAYGKDQPSALLECPRAVLEYTSWAARHAGSEVFESGHMDFRLVETYQVYSIDEQFNEVQDGLEINAFFRDDWRPLSEAETALAANLVTWAREDLLATVAELPAEILDAPHEGQRWTMRGIVAHMATAQWWYLDRMGAGGARSALPKDPFQRLDTVFARLMDTLPGLAGSRQVVGLDGEFWSPRKFVRRSVWHLLDHIRHVHQLL